MPCDYGSLDHSRHENQERDDVGAGDVSIFPPDPTPRPLSLDVN